MNYIRLGKKIYNTKNTSETRRMLVFIVRCLLNTGRMNRLHRFFMKDDVRRRIAAEYPFVYEQPTRAFFYNQSTFDERARLVEQHMEYLEKHIKEDVFLGLYSAKGMSSGKAVVKLGICVLSSPIIRGSARKGFYLLLCASMRTTCTR